MPKDLLSDAKVRTAKSDSKPYKLSDGGGLFLLIQPTGSKLWRWKFRLNGKENLFAMNREQLIGLIQSDAKFIDEREDIAECIRGLPVNEALDENQIRSGFDRFKAEKKTRELTGLANRHALDASALQAFVDDILRRRIFDDERLSELMAPLELGWKARTQKELALMEELTPLLHKLAQGREIAGLAAYEEGR